MKLEMITLCAASSVNIDQTIDALRRSMANIKFARVVLFSDVEHIEDCNNIELVRIAHIASSAEYSRFVLHDLATYIDTAFTLLVQWDGFVTNPAAWNDKFLEFDYVGAPWPQFHDGMSVGNGGFSLRSRNLLDACAFFPWEEGAAEDIAICRTHRKELESQFGIRFADEDTALGFSVERALGTAPSLGFHGVFNMPRLVGAREFARIYATLDDRASIYRDLVTIVRDLFLFSPISDWWLSMLTTIRLCRDFLAYKIDLTRLG